MFRVSLITLLAMQASFLSAQLYEYTNGGNTDAWENNENWKRGGQDPADDFPDDNAEAAVDGVAGLLNSKLSQNIELSSFLLNPSQQFSLNLNGNTLDVNSLTESGATSIIRDGTLNVENLNIDDLRVVNTTFNLADGAITGSGFQLWSGTEATLTGTLSLNGTDFGSGDDDAKFINAGGAINKTNADALNNVSFPFQQTGGSINVPQGTLVFTKSFTLSGGQVNATGGDSLIRFQGPVTLQGGTFSPSSGGNIVFTGSVTGTVLETAGDSDGNLSLDISSDGPFSIGTYMPSNGAVLALNQGTQDTNLSFTNEGEFIWGGGVLDDVFNNDELRIEPTGASFSVRRLSGILSNTAAMEIASSVILIEGGVMQNEAGGTIRVNSGTINPDTGALEQSGFANLGTIETPFDKGSLTIATRIINQGEIIINRGSVNFFGPSELEGQVTLQPHNFDDDFQTQFSVGGDSAIAHTINALAFVGEAPAGDQGRARAIFGRGSYNLAGAMSSTAAAASDQVSVFIERGTWVSDTGGSFNFAENLPLEVGGENTFPIFQLDQPLTNSGHMEITRARVIGAEAFSNQGTITSQRLEVGDDDTDGRFTNENELTLSGGATSFIDIEEGSLFLNQGENAVLSLVASAAIESPIGSTQIGLENSGTIQTVAPSNGKSINVPFRQKDLNSAMIEAVAGGGNLTIRKKAEIEEGILRSATTIFINDDVEWGRSATPEVQLVGGGEINYVGNDKQFTLLDNLNGSGQGIFELDSGILAPEEGQTKDINFSEETSLRIDGGQLGVSTTTLRNFGNIDQQGGELHGTLINAGIYDMDIGTFEGATFTNLNTFNWNGTNISGTIDNTNALTDEGPRPAMTITGTGTLLTNAALTNNGGIAHTGSVRMQSGSKIDMVSGTYSFIDSGSIQSDPANITDTLVEVQSGATLLSTREESSSSSSAVNVGAFHLNGGTLEVSRPFASLNVNTSNLEFNGGTIKISDFGEMQLVGDFQGDQSKNRFDSITIGKNATLTLRDTDGDPIAIVSNNILNRGTLNGNVVQSGIYDSFDPDDDLVGAQPSTIDGDLTQVAGDDLKTVVRADNEGASTINVEGTATVTGDVTIVLDANYEGTEIPIMTAAEMVASWNTEVQIVSPAPGLSGTISYPTPQTAIVTIERDPDAGDPTNTYRNFVYTHFDADERLNEAVWGPDADPDGDGVNNLRSFAQGDDPTDGVPPPPLIDEFAVIQDFEKFGNGYGVELALRILDNPDGVNVDVFDLGDPSDPTDDFLVNTVNNSPDAPADRTLLVWTQDEAPSENGDYFEVDLSLAEGEEVL